MNGVYLRALPPTSTPTRSSRISREQGYDWDEQLDPRGGAARAGEDREARRVPRVRGLPLPRRRADPRSSTATARSSRPRATRSPSSSRSRPSRSRPRCARVLDRLGLKPRQGFQPIRIAVTGSKISPGPLRVDRAARARGDARAAQRGRVLGSRFGGASGSSARWNSSQDLRRNLIDGAGRLSSVRFVPPRLTSALMWLVSFLPILRSKRRPAHGRYGVAGEARFLLTRLPPGVGGGNEARGARRRRRTGDPAPLQGQSRARRLRGAGGRHTRGRARASDRRRRRRPARHAHRQRARRGAARRSCGSSEIPVAVVTGSADLDSVKGIADAVLGKPFTIDELEATVAQARRTRQVGSASCLRQRFAMQPSTSPGSSSTTSSAPRKARAVRVGEKEVSEQAAIVARYRDLFTREQLDALHEAEAARRRRARALCTGCARPARPGSSPPRSQSRRMRSRTRSSARA